jgi:hypothetical protein
LFGHWCARSHVFTVVSLAKSTTAPPRTWSRLRFYNRRGKVTARAPKLIYVNVLYPWRLDGFKLYQWSNQEFFRGGLTNSVEDRGQRERGYGCVSPQFRGSGGSCNLVKEISYSAYTLCLYSYSQHWSIYSGLYSCCLGYVREFLLFLHWLPLDLVILLRMYFPRNWEFGSALSKLRNFGRGGVNPQNLPPR